MNPIRQLLNIDDAGKIPGGQLVISKTTFKSLDAKELVSPFLVVYYDGNPITITKAKANAYVSGDDRSVIITGKSDYLLIAKMPLTLTLTLDKAGNIQLLLEYNLIGPVAKPTGWKFSKSFKELPAVFSYQKLGETQVSPLDDLILFNTYYVLTTQDESYKDIPLKAGLNFYSAMTPSGILSIFETLIGGSGDLILYGTINIPLEHQITIPLLPLQLPWDVEGGVPAGINLKADLKVDAVTIGKKMSFDIKDFRMYSPHSKEWLAKNDTYKSVVAYTGEFDVPSTGKDPVEIIALAPPGAGGVELIAEFGKQSIASLDTLVDITNSKKLLSSMPTEIQSATTALKSLQIERLAVNLAYSNKKIEVEGTSITIGMPKLGWTIWDTGVSFKVKKGSISSRFDVYRPFSSKPKLDITVQGTIAIQSVDVEITATKSSGFTVMARLVDKQTIPLKSFMKKHLPGIPPPSDLDINALIMVAAPGKYYSMNLMMAQEPNPWKLSLGFTDLEFADVSLMFMKVKGQNVGGSVSAVTKIAGLELAARYDIPGDFMLRGELPSITLSKIFSELSQLPVTFPGGFDLTFDNSWVLIQKKGGEYTFELATLIEEFGSLAFVVEKGTSGKWGAAAGLMISKAQISKLKGVGSFVDTFNDWFPFDQFVLAVSSLDSNTFSFPGFQQFGRQELGNSKIAMPASISGIKKGFYLYTSTTFTRKNKILKALIDILKIPEGTQLDAMLAYLSDQRKFRMAVSLTTFLTPMKKVSDRTAQGPLAYKNTALIGALFIDTGGSDGFTFGLSATVKTIIQDSNVDFNATLAIMANGIYVSGTMITQRPIEFGHLKIANLALELGISFEGLPSFGFAASLMVDGLFHSSIAVMVDTANPSQSMIAGSLSDLTLRKIVDKLVGDPDEIPEALDQLFDEIAITGSQHGSFSIAKTPAKAMAKALDNYNGAVISQNFMKYGKLSSFPSSSDGLTIFKDDTEPKWYITSRTGGGDNSIMTHFQLVKDNSGVINVSKEAQFYFVPSPQGSYIGKFFYPGGIQVSGRLKFLIIDLDVDVIIVYNKGISINAELEKIVIGNEHLFSLTAAQGSGGPEISVSSFNNPAAEKEEFKKPHFYINGQLEMLGMKKSVFVNITTSGAEFDINGDIIPLLVRGDLHGKIDGIDDLEVGGKLEVGIGKIDLGSLGSVDIDTGAEAEFEMYVKKGDIGASLDVDFELAGEKLHITKFDLDIDTTDLSKLPEVIFKAIKNFLIDLFKSPEQWAKFAVKAMNMAEDKVAEGLANIFGIKDKEKVKTILNAVFPICAVTSALGSLM